MTYCMMEVGIVMRHANPRLHQTVPELKLASHRCETADFCYMTNMHIDLSVGLFG